MLAWDYDLKSTLYDPASDTWTATARVPLDFAECYPTSAATTDFALAYYCGRAALLDIESEAWSAIAVPGQMRRMGGRFWLAAEPVPAEDAFLFAGGDLDDPRVAAFWAYKP